MVDADECKPRVDNEHEVLSFRRKTLKTKQLLKVASGGNYVKSSNEKDLLALGKNLSITKLGANVLYSRFWYANYRGLPGLHTSCPPDWLHTIIKGAVEKTLAASLLIVEHFSHFDISVIYGGNVVYHGSTTRASWTTAVNFFRFIFSSISFVGT